MNKADLKKYVKNSTTTCTIDSILEGISASLAKGEDVTLVGFGTFSVTDRVARVGRNPSTGESMNIAASKSVKFKAGKLLKSLVK